MKDRRFTVLIPIFVLVGLLSFSGNEPHDTGKPPKRALHFEENRGQLHSAVRFLARNDAYTVFLTTTDALVVAHGTQPSAMRLRFLDTAGAQIEGIDAVPGKANYLVGNDPNNWHTGISRFSRVLYKDIYPLTDVVYYSDGGDLRYDLIVRPGAQPRSIRLAIDGAEELTTRNGALVIRAASGEFELKRPVIYQKYGSLRRQIAGSYRIEPGNTVRFEIGSFDATQALIIDPTLSYSTLLGGNGEDIPYGIAVDAVGNTYVAGTTASPDFPTTLGSLRSSRAANSRPFMFVSKLNANGSELIYSTYIAASDTQEDAFVSPTTIAVDRNGNAYIAGAASSNGIPTTERAFQRTASGNDGHSFVVKLNATGSALSYSTYVSGNDDVTRDVVNQVVVDDAGSAYIAGETSSRSFPTTAGVVQPTRNSYFGDGFVAKLNPDGSALVFSTLLGGTGDDRARYVAVDSARNVLVAGVTDSSDFPVTPGAFQIVKGNTFGNDTFLTKLNPTATDYVYSTYLGGNNTTAPQALQVDAAGNAIVMGFTGAPDFPITPGAYQTSRGNSAPGFFAKFSQAGNLLYSSFLPSFWAAGMDAAGRFYFLGSEIYSFDPTASTLPYVTKLAGFTGDVDTTAKAMAVDAAGNVYLTGYTASTSFPTTPGSYQTSLKLAPARRDGFIVKISPERSVPVVRSLTPASVTPGSIRTGLTLAVVGLHFEPNSVILWNGSALDTTFRTITELRATITPADVANVDSVAVSVRTPDVGDSNPLPFSLGPNPVPWVSALSPSVVDAGSSSLSFPLRITGSGFLPTSVVYLNGARSSTSYTNGTQLSVFLPAALVAAPGTVTVTVVNPPPGGGESNRAVLTVRDRSAPPSPEVPTVTELIPASIPAGSASFILTVNGTGFVPESVIQWEGVGLLTRVLSSTAAQAFIFPTMIASEGLYTIRVVNGPGGATSNPLPFQVTARLPNPLPTIESLSQNSAAAGTSSVVLTISGQDFRNGASVRWNGIEKPTTAVPTGSGDTIQLKATLSAEELANPGLAYVTVSNPPPGGGPSPGVTFAVYESKTFDLATSDLLYDPSRGKVYASRPAISRTDRNTISQINPDSGTVERSVEIGNEPGKLVMTDDYTAIYVVFDQGRQVRRLDLNSFTAGPPFAVESPWMIQDLKVVPGQPGALALSLQQGSAMTGQVAIYDNGVKRPKIALAFPLQLGFSASRQLYGCSAGGGLQDLHLLAIDAAGVSISSTTRGLCEGAFEVGSGLFYTPLGGVVNPEGPAEVGRHPLAGNNLSVRPDAAAHKTFYVAYNGSAKVASVLVFDETNFALIGSLDIQGVTNRPSALIRIGADRIAFRTEDRQVFFVRLPSMFFAEPYTVEFAQYANGLDYSSSIIVTNPSTTEVARGSINLYGETGLPLYPPAYYPRFAAALPFTIPPLGSFTFTPKRDFILVTGSARISSNIRVNGVVRFGSETLGAAGVEGSTPAPAVMAPVVRDAARQLNTGIALSNPQTDAIDVLLTLRALDGTEVAGGSATRQLPPNGHLAKFIDELFPTAQTSDFQGTLTIRTNTPRRQVAAIALQLGSTAGEFTTLPVVSIEPTGATELIFPEFASGAGASTSIFLINPSDRTATGTLNFYDDGGRSSQVPFTIAPGGAAVYSTSDSDMPLSGWASASSDTALGGVLRFRLPGIGIAGVQAATPSTGFVAPVLRSESANFTTGVAIVATESTATLSMTLRNQEGMPVPNGTVSVTIPANGHISKFIQELFANADTREFQGTLSVMTDEGLLAGIAIQLGARQGQFTTLPVISTIR